ncbi:MAG TPA: ATP-binding protein [Steroidobacter sp.]|uniref:sensor histidine kinase n=1 Tax=Steroidobacter sp. TaxID=1978227 RepID=UPI002ED81DE2
MAEPAQLAADVRSLQRCINDLVSVVTLPALWAGASPEKIVRLLVETLSRMLDLDFVYARIGPSNGAPTAILHAVPALDSSPNLSEQLDAWFEDNSQAWAPRRAQVNGADLTLFPLRLGLLTEAGVLVAGCRRPDFPLQTESLLLTVAANQAAIALQEARASELSLQRMIETIPGMLWSATPDGMIDYCNGRLLDYAGFAPHEVMGTNWVKLLHPDDVPRTVPIWLECVRTGAPYRVEVRTYFAAEQTYRWCVTDALPLYDERGNILKWYGTVVDMHDWKQAQEELRATQGELAYMARVMTLGELTASIAHELNQPLAGIVTNSSTCLRMLAGDPPNVTGASETVRRTIRDANRASDVIKRLRALFARKEIAAEAVDLNDAAREVLALCNADLERNRVVLRLDFANDLPPVSGDRVQLQQVILNLIGNASDAMASVQDRPRELLIRTELDTPGSVRVTVQDNGVGFKPEDAEKMFVAFHTTKTGGMGIGLSVSRSIIQSHQGELWATPNAWHGASFCFRVPCERPIPRSL